MFPFCCKPELTSATIRRLDGRIRLLSVVNDAFTSTFVQNDDKIKIDKNGLVHFCSWRTIWNIHVLPAAVQVP